MPRTIEFWYEFASPYSYLSAMRIDDLAADCGVTVIWRPFLLGPIFREQGWSTSPFVLYKAKGEYMWRDVQRLAGRYGLPAISRPDPFPQHSLLAARAAIAIDDAAQRRRFSQLVFRQEFCLGKDIANRENILSCLGQAGADGKEILRRAASEEIKGKLRDAVGRAGEIGIFGAPSFLADGELFWGDDRLEQALEYAASGCDRVLQSDRLTGPGNPM